jgi:hypothetical protein
MGLQLFDLHNIMVDPTGGFAGQIEFSPWSQGGNGVTPAAPHSGEHGRGCQRGPGSGHGQSRAAQGGSGRPGCGI